LCEILFFRQGTAGTGTCLRRKIWFGRRRLLPLHDHGLSEYAASATVESLRRDSEATGCIPGDVAALSQWKKNQTESTFSQHVCLDLDFTDAPAHAAAPQPTARWMPHPRARVPFPQLLPTVSHPQPRSVSAKHMGPSHLQKAVDRPQHSGPHAVQAARWKARTPRSIAPLLSRREYAAACGPWL
jgi:hypothetical protein